MKIEGEAKRYIHYFSFSYAGGCFFIAIIFFLRVNISIIFKNEEERSSKSFLRGRRSGANGRSRSLWGVVSSREVQIGFRYYGLKPRRVCSKLISKSFIISIRLRTPISSATLAGCLLLVLRNLSN